MDVSRREASLQEVKKLINEFAASFKEKIFGENEPREYKGHFLLPGLASVENIRHLCEWRMPENSVFVSSYPKTGSTWCNEIVRNILYVRDDETLRVAKSIPTAMLLIEMPPQSTFAFYDKLPLPKKFFRTHLAEELFNYEELKRSKSKMIYVIRNPKDQLVSHFHFSQKMPVDEEARKKFGKNWDDFFTSFVKGGHVTCQKKGEWYPDHILGWLKRRNDENFMIVEYESMTKDFQSEIRRIAKFLEMNLTDEEVERVAENCSIGTMRKTADQDLSGFMEKNIRKGGVGGWKNQFTVAQSELMDKLIEEKLGDSGIKFTYVL